MIEGSGRGYMDRNILYLRAAERATWLNVKIPLDPRDCARSVSRWEMYGEANLLERS